MGWCERIRGPPARHDCIRPSPLFSFLQFVMLSKLAGMGAARQIHMESLPFHVPDLNPVEWLWRQLQESELPNLACSDLEEIHLQFHISEVG
jgi:hypothetical protein